MSDRIRNLIRSGILELYVLGLATIEQSQEVEELAQEHAEIAEELNRLNFQVEEYGKAHAVKPPAIIKTFVMATIDYMERMQSGEEPSFPPALSENSEIEDYLPWLERPDMLHPASTDGIVAKIIGNTPERTTCIVWVPREVEPEVHSHERESFLVVEGTCELYLGDDTFYLKPGDFISIPLHVKHSAKVTSEGPCKIILEHANF